MPGPQGAIGPIDYSTGADNPLTTFTQGIQSGLQTQAAQLQLQQQQVAVAQQRAYMDAARQVMQNGNRPADIANLAVQFPQMAAGLKDASGMQNDAKTQDRVNTAVPIYAAVQNGDIPTATNLMEQQAQARENSGDIAGAQQTRVMSQLLQKNPDWFKLHAGLLLANAMTPEKFADTFKDIGTAQTDASLAPAKIASANAAATIDTSKAGVAPEMAQADLQKAKADATTAAVQAGYAPGKEAAQIANIIGENQNRLDRLGLDKDTLISNMANDQKERDAKYGPAVQGKPLINEASAAASMSIQAADRASTLADKIEQAGNDKLLGLNLTSPIEFVKNKLGVQTDYSQLQTEYNQLRTSGVIGSLKGVGRITDREMAAASKGWPEGTADAAYVATFLRGMAKLQQLNAATNNAQADWAQQVGSLAAPKTDIEVRGIQVPAGTPYSTFVHKYTPILVKQIQDDAATSTVQNRNYYKTTVPAPAATPASAPAADPNAAGQ